MRIVAWNCCRGPLQRKLEALATLAPDVAVLSEAPPPAEASSSVAWFPSGASKLGVQVRAFGPYQLQALPRADLPNCVNPIRVVGPTEFNLLAVWTWPAPSYVKSFLAGLAAYAELLARGPLVVAGDFNGNPAFDKPRGIAKWRDAFSTLNRANLVSAYHHARGVGYGSEPEPTHLFLRKPDRKFHIDFCFVPELWAERGLAVSIPHEEAWLRVSDHLPLVVEAEA